MKIRNFFTVLLSVILILGILGLAGYITYIMADSSNPVKQKVNQILHIEAEVADDTPVETESSAAEQTSVVPVQNPAVPEGTAATPAEEDTTAAEAAVPTAQSAASVKEHSYIFVGDSRVLGMKEAVADSCTYLGAEGEGYSWLSGDGQLALADCLGSSQNATVILNFGVNDPENVSLYAEIYNKLISEFPSANFYILSVNPLDVPSDAKVTSEMVELFNQTLAAEFPGKFLNCYDYLKTNGYQTIDGIHYSKDTYRNIHDWTVAQIG